MWGRQEDHKLNKHILKFEKPVQHPSEATIWELGRCAGLGLRGEVQSGYRKPWEVNGTLEKRRLPEDMGITALVTHEVLSKHELPYIYFSFIF